MDESQSSTETPAADPRVDQLARDMLELKAMIQQLAVKSSQEGAGKKPSADKGQTPVAARTRSKKKGTKASKGTKAGASSRANLSRLAAGGFTESEVTGAEGGIFAGATTTVHDSESEEEEEGELGGLDGEGAGGQAVGAAVLVAGGLYNDDEATLWGEVLKAVSVFRLLPKKERKRRFREALNDLSPSDKTLDYLAELYWGSLSVAKFLPSTLRGAQEEESEFAELKVMADGSTRVELKRGKSTKVGGLALRAPEWQRGMLTFFDVYGKVVSPVLAVWGLRYMNWFLEFLDGGYSWVSLLRAEHAARREIGKELRTLTRGVGGRGQRFWGTIGDDAMRHTLALNPGYKPEQQQGAAAGGGKFGRR